MAPTIAIHEATETWTIASAGNLVLFVGRAPVEKQVVERLHARIRSVGAQHPAGAGYLHVIESNGAITDVPSEETRRAFTAIARDPGPSARAALIVIERTGFRGAAMRAIVSGILLAGGTKMPVKVASSVASGAEWFLRTLREGGAKEAWGAHDLDELTQAAVRAMDAAAGHANA